MTPPFPPDARASRDVPELRYDPQPKRRSSSAFDFTRSMWRLCHDITARLPELHHVDVDRVAVCCSQTRKRTRYGLWASLTPMRFQDGRRIETRNGQRYSCQRLVNRSGVEMLYILTFYLPRFLDLSFKDKLVTVLHELWHISPKFDGDIRRHPGRFFAHTHSEQKYDAAMAVLAERWLDRGPPPLTYRFLEHSFAQLQRRHGHVVAILLPRPRLVRLP